MPRESLFSLSAGLIDTHTHTHADVYALIQSLAKSKGDRITYVKLMFVDLCMLSLVYILRFQTP